MEKVWGYFLLSVHHATTKKLADLKSFTGDARIPGDLITARINAICLFLLGKCIMLGLRPPKEFLKNILTYTNSYAIRMYYVTRVIQYSLCILT